MRRSQPSLSLSSPQPTAGKLDDKMFRSRYAFLYDEVLPGDKQRLTKALKARRLKERASD